MDKKNKERTTPPPASQERGGLRWPSSLGIAAIAREIWGNPIPPEAYAFAKRLHSAASPPSSAAEASINSPEIDSKLIPDAAEQAKPDDCPFCGQPQHYTDEDCPLLSRAHTTAVAEQAQAGERLSVDEIEGYAKGLEARDMFAEAALLRRLAGGVTVDDAMTERACICHYPRWEVFSDPTRIAARASMRRLLVAALGAK